MLSHERYGPRDIGGRYADLARALGGWSERVERPEDIAGAFARARTATEGAQAALLEFITSQETRFSNRGVLHSGRPRSRTSSSPAGRGGGGGLSACRGPSGSPWRGC